jgi:hypothetical protein
MAVTVKTCYRLGITLMDGEDGLGIKNISLIHGRDGQDMFNLIHVSDGQDNTHHTTRSAQHTMHTTQHTTLST